MSKEPELGPADDAQLEAGETTPPSEAANPPGEGVVVSEAPEEGLDGAAFTTEATKTTKMTNLRTGLSRTILNREQCQRRQPLCSSTNVLPVDSASDGLIKSSVFGVHRRMGISPVGV